MTDNLSNATKAAMARLRKSHKYDPLHRQGIDFRQRTFPGWDAEAFKSHLVKVLDTEDNHFRSEDIDHLKSFGPYNRDAWTDWKGEVESYYSVSPYDEKMFKELWPFFLEVSREIKKHNGGCLQFASIGESFDRIDWKKNSGLPYMTLNATQAEKDHYLGRAMSFLSGDSVTCHPFVLGHRSQPKGMDKTKNRPVWMSEKTETILSGLLSIPLTKALHNVPCFTGFNGVQSVESLSSVWFREEKYYLSLDFSKFDQSCGPTLMKLALAAIYNSFEYKEGMIRVFEWLWDVYCNTPIVTPDGEREGIHGLPSGVGLTSCIGSIVNAAFQRYYATLHKVDYSLSFGDDAVVGSDQPFDFEEVERAASYFGLIASKEKQYAGINKFSFLGRYFDVEYPQGVQPIGRIASACYFLKSTIQRRKLESLVDEGVITDENQYYSSMWCGRLSECADHPMIQTFVDWLAANLTFEVKPVSDVYKLKLKDVRYSPNNYTKIAEAFASAYARGVKPCSPKFFDDIEKDTFGKKEAKVRANVYAKIKAFTRSQRAKAERMRDHFIRNGQESLAVKAYKEKISEAAMKAKEMKKRRGN